MAAPTFISEAETTFAAGTGITRNTASVPVQIGDVLAVLGATEGYPTPDINTVDDGVETWTEVQAVNVTDYCVASVWRAIVTANGSNVISVTRSGVAGSPYAWGANALLFRGTDGSAASAKANGGKPTASAPTLNLTTTQANSAIVVVVGDWSAGDGSSRTWRTVNSITPTSGNGYERTYFRDAARCTIYMAYYPDVGAAGVKTVGLSAPTMEWSIAAMEVKGTGVSPPPPPTPGAKDFDAAGNLLMGW